MENKLFIAVFVAICCFSSTESSFFAKKSILANETLLSRVQTCDLRNLTNASTSKAFPSILSCNADVVVGLEANNIVPEAAVGIQCTYTYSCSFDLPSSRRSTVLSCSENGQWKGKMPDCSEDDEIVQTIIQFFSEDLSQINELEENRVNFTETKIDEKKSLNLTGSRTQALKSKNKTLNNARNQALDRLCDSKTMCRTLRGAHQCIRVVHPGPHYWFRLRLCHRCYYKYCRSSSLLLS